ncbi:unnamed protein product [Phytophthora lilii]|uniref:Unnamed protein product n=1 Tax=Phytophthora lilii TaxID=2077276 RepID=A0A9W6X808_9STRA|nr:unnamed protein product [Phytophthora lilii]
MAVTRRLKITAGKRSAALHCDADNEQTSSSAAARAAHSDEEGAAHRAPNSECILRRCQQCIAESVGIGDKTLKSAGMTRLTCSSASDLIEVVRGKT